LQRIIEISFSSFSLFIIRHSSLSDYLSALAARTKLKKMIIPLMLLFEVKKLIVLPIIITAIALVGIKGLGASLMSLLISGAVTLKTLLTPPPPPRVSYGVVRPHEIHHDHWHRSEQEINHPYKGWAPEYNGEQYQQYYDTS